MNSSSAWTPQLTQDGSFTFFSEEFGETFHSQQGARAEAFSKFVQATSLAQKANRDRLCLLDVCYGLGYNTAAALETIWAANPACDVEVYGLELDSTVPRAAIEPPLIELWAPPIQTALTTIATEYRYEAPGLRAKLLIGDARQTVQHLIQAKFQADAVFFDPFSPRRCPQLWTVEFFQKVAQCLTRDGKLATYSRSAAVRSAMCAAGLQIGTIPLDRTQSAHAWAEGTVAAFDGAELHPLSPMEQEHLHTRAAVPYHDPDLCNTTEEILARHQQEQQRSTLESTSSWRRRWGIV